MKRKVNLLIIALMMVAVSTSYGRDTEAYESLVQQQYDLQDKMIELETLQYNLSEVVGSKSYKKRICAVKKAIYLYGLNIQDKFPELKRTLKKFNSYFALMNNIESTESQLFEYQKNMQAMEDQYHKLLIDRRVLVDQYDVMKYTLDMVLKTSIKKYMSYTDTQVEELKVDLAEIERQVAIFELSISMND